MKQCLVINSVSDTPISSGYTPDQIKLAYNLGRSGNGEGISVAVIDFIGNPYIKQNLEVFSREFGLAPPEISEHGTIGANEFDFSAYIEPCVDSQWVHAISPRASINIVRAPGYSIAGAASAVRLAIDVGSDIILLTFQTQLTSLAIDYLDIFDADAVFVASAGDFGAQANYPACSPYCISVGGTELEISELGERLSEETVWSGTGGGICELFEIPEYQERMAGIAEQTGGRRGVPDISFLGTPEPGFAVYHSSVQGSFGWYSVGGTSVSASVVAGIIANMLSGEDFSGLKKRDVLPELYRLAGGTSYSNEYGIFFDITSGSNGKFYAKRGYDLCTGLGSLINL